MTVFRDGRRIDTFDAVTDLDRDRLIGCMVGRSIEDVYGYRPRPAGDVLIEAKGLAGPGLSEPVSFTARRGEIVGFFSRGRRPLGADEAAVRRRAPSAGTSS